MVATVDSVDLFCGAGGSSSGLFAACEELKLKLNLLAINHWNLAIETHIKNHPYARHLCETLDSVDPKKEVPSRKLRILVASPECTNHTDAKGGAACNDQSRATAWHVCRWCDALNIEDILIENVHQFERWGPLDANGKPIKSRRGETFKAFLNALISLSYRLEYRRINCADYGDPTTRERLFIIGRRRKKIVWPDITHTIDGRDGTKKWRTAREVIDWKLKAKSIFNRPVPLSKNTLRRIAIGLKRFGGQKAQPFLVMLYGTGTVRSVDRPLPTVTAQGNHIGLCEPFFIKYYGTATAVSIDEPFDTITTLDRFGLVIPKGSDITFRVLQPHELAAGMSFENGYYFSGNRREKIMQIGNSVPKRTAQALCQSLLAS
jgi:DNA (cytosine-5)-methyltransferase 1